MEAVSKNLLAAIEVTMNQMMACLEHLESMSDASTNLRESCATKFESMTRVLSADARVITIGFAHEHDAITQDLVTAQNLIKAFNTHVINQQPIYRQS